jgi:hypothetical protein
LVLLTNPTNARAKTLHVPKPEQDICQRMIARDGHE